MIGELPIGDFIRQLRRELDLTQNELGRRVGCATITIRKIEAEDVRPSVQIAERLAQALAIPDDQSTDFIRRIRLIRPELKEASTPPPKPDEIGLADLSGHAVRGYRLSEKIGSGLMGVVYRATQPVIEREVAIKIILPKYANDPSFIRRFETEAKFVAHLEHPHIVPLYDYWREPGVAYLVMRLMRGGSLQQMIQGEPLPVASAEHILEQITSALSVAHRFGIIHRDLKPGNILLDEDENAYLSDFGVAIYLGNAKPTAVAETNAMVGSPKYMSPEQIRALPVQPQSDIYCLGVMLYEMLTGKAPFSGPTPSDYIQQHISTPVPPLSTDRVGLPEALDAVIAHATAKDPEDRYRDVLLLLQEFRQAVSSVHNRNVTISKNEVVPGEIVNPYKGLNAFGEADADDFFGREILIYDLLARLNEEDELSRFLAIIGPSGSGKSSVARAGLLPALRRGGLPGSENWFFIDMLPGNDPFGELEAALLRVAINSSENLLAQLKDGNRGLRSTVNRLLPDDPAVELVLLIDQFEELFTMVENEQERSLFLNNLVEAIIDERSRMRIIITLRADFIDRPLWYVDFGEFLKRRNEFVLPLNPEELESAIVNPANRAGIKIEPGLVLTIAHDLGGQHGALPLLQYTLTLLVDRREGIELTKEAYQALGGVSGVLRRNADEVFNQLNPSEQAFTRQLFLRLVTLGEDGDDMRRRVPRSEIETLTDRDVSTQIVIDAFSKSRLLYFDSEPITHLPTIEVAHEALLREWNRLREWIDESRADVRLQRQLATAANEWENAGREDSYLLTGTHLVLYEEWNRTTSLTLTPLERDFFFSSLNLRTKKEATESDREIREAKLRKRAQRILQILVGVFLIAAIISGGLALYSFDQRQEALRKASIGLAAQAQSELNGSYPERSVLLALEALEKYPYTWQAEQALGQIVHEFRLKHIFSGHQDTVIDAAWSPDGTHFATTGMDGSLRIWDAATQIELFNISAHLAFDAGFKKGVRDLSWSPDGERIATAGSDKTAKVWNVENGKGILTIDKFNDEVWGVAWSPDGKWIASAVKDGSISVWDATSGAAKLTLTGHSAGVKQVAWSQNGIYLASASEDGTARIWEAQTGAELALLSGHTGAVRSVSWSMDGKQVATASEDRTVRLWDAVNGSELSDIRLNSPVWQAAWSPDGSQLATTNADGLAQVWDVASRKEDYALQGHTLEPFGISWSPDGKALATTGGADFSVRIWDASPAAQTFSGAQEGIYWVSWSPDGKRIATTAADNSAVIWDSQSGKPLLKLPGYITPGYPPGTASDVFWSPDSSRVVTTGWDNLAKVWDANTGELLVTFSNHVGEPVGKFNGINALFGGGWSPDGSRIGTVGGSGIIRVWDARTGEEYFAFEATKDVGPPTRWSPDGRHLATCSIPQVLQIWDASTGEPILGGFTHNTDVLTLGDPVDLCMASHWSPDGKHILTTSWGGNGATIWNAKTGEKELVFTEHTTGVTFPAWSPNGKRIATGETSGAVKIWDAKTGDVLLSFSMPINDLLFNLAWSPDGTRLTGVGTLPYINIYRVWQSTKDLIDYTRECCVVRQLTPQERQQFNLP